MLKLSLIILFAALLGIGAVKTTQTIQKTSNVSTMEDLLDNKGTILKNDIPGMYRRPFIVGTAKPVPIPDKWEARFYRIPYDPSESKKPVK